MQFEIKNWITGKIKFTAEIDCADDAPLSIKIGLAVKWGIKSGADLSRADLNGADLSRANLSRANLSRAYLIRADLYGADLSRANLSRAYLSRANLSRADLYGANLNGADLSRANLNGADLSGADLNGANLSRADLYGTDLIDGGQRSDGYRFIGWIKEDVLQIRAGCRDFSIDKARDHWLETRKDTPLGAETMCILDHIEAVAKIRQLVK